MPSSLAKYGRILRMAPERLGFDRLLVVILLPRLSLVPQSHLKSRCHETTPSAPLFASSPQGVILRLITISHVAISTTTMPELEESGMSPNLEHQIREGDSLTWRSEALDPQRSSLTTSPSSSSSLETETVH
ncbi:hypothetical protein TIFTF001_046594 [Ficus carica]|uniref:Uncharacterized protein n=1 Tax=Ficus carica TaxID=3494 RepID=A0AA87ZEJ2_FICCA|nr:hypothetical protein TIFTF001_046594 [Ficus carica]